MCGIYIIINKINDKCYVGQAIDIKSRFTNHRSTAFNQNDPCYDYPLYRAIRKYGIENFSFEVLEECLQSELNDKEKFYVAKHNAYTNGYNQTLGGDCTIIPQKLTEDKVDLIIERLSTSLDSCKKIGDDFDVSATMIEAINNGKSWRVDGRNYPIRPPLREMLDKTNDNYCKSCGKQIAIHATLCRDCLGKSQRRVANRPAPLELAKMIKEIGFTQTGKRFGVDGNSIKGWCKSYNIPHKMQELIDWYNNQIGIVDAQKEKRIRTPITEIVRSVKQIDKNTGEVLNMFPSIKAAALAMGNKNMDRHIGAACHGKRKTAYGYIWEFA